jgi:putative transposase
LARLPRLVVPGQAHYLIQRAHSGVADAGVVTDAEDRAAFIAALQEAAAAEQVQVHAYALLAHEVQLLATPAGTAGLGRMMQAVGRRYVSAYNRKHQRRGTLWDGRFRCAVVEPGATRLAALQLIDGQSSNTGATSASHRQGGLREPLLVDPPEVWQLGNTPFEREAAYRTLLAQGLPAATAQLLRNAALGGWAAGSAAFVAQLAASAARQTQPRPRGRPRQAQR